MKAIADIEVSHEMLRGIAVQSESGLYHVVQVGRRTVFDVATQTATTQSVLRDGEGALARRMCKEALLSACAAVKCKVSRVRFRDFTDMTGLFEEDDNA